MSTTISEQENEVRDRQSISIDAGDMIGGAMAADEVVIDESQDLELSDNPDKKDIQAEKERIKTQRSSREANRKDSFSIGTVCLNIPPTQISIVDESKNYRYSAMRQKGEIIGTSGRNNTRIDLDIFFNGFEDINSKLRPIIAQLKTVPFIQIENEHVRSVLSEYGAESSLAGKLSSMKENERRLSDGDKRADEVVKLIAQGSAYTNDAKAVLKNLHDTGLMRDEDYAIIDSGFDKPNEVLSQHSTDSDTILDKSTGKMIVDPSLWVKNRMVIEDGSDMFGPILSVSRLSEISNSIRALEEKIKSIGLSEYEINKRSPIVCVLSQISVATVPGFDKTLNCKMTLYIFNYQAYSIDFGYISGYNKNNFTTDISKCDMFIDWYTKRWLSESRDTGKEGLGRYTGGERIKFVYATKNDVLSVGMKTNESEQRDSLSYRVEGDVIDSYDGLFSVTGISVSMRNAIQFLPILSCKHPTCQYLGGMSSDVRIIIETTSDDVVRKFSTMFDKIRALSRTVNRINRRSYILVQNELLMMFAMRTFSVEDFSVDTMQGSHGCYSISIGLSEYKLNQEEFQKLNREKVLSETSKTGYDTEIFKAAEWIIRKANEYASGGGAQYVSYYNEVADRDSGWFSKNSNILSTFMISIKENRSKNVQLKKKIDSMIMSNRTSNRIVEYANSAAAILSQPGILFGPEAQREPFLKSEYDDLVIKFSNSLLNDQAGSNSFWESNLTTFAMLASIMKRQEIVDRLIVDKRNNIELANYMEDLTSNNDLFVSDLSTYCYPDLDLPRYSELINGGDLVNTNMDMGVMRDDGDDYVASQVDSSVADPDFFFFRGSIFRLANAGNEDASSDYLFNGFKRGVDFYKGIGLSNKKFRRSDNLPSEIDFVQELTAISEKHELSRGYNTENNGKDNIQKNELTSDDIKKLQSLELDVESVVDGDTFSVKFGDRSVSVRLRSYDSEEKRGSPKLRGRSQSDEEIQRAMVAKQKLSNMLEGKKVKLTFGQTKSDIYGRAIASARYYDDKTNSWISVDDEMLKDAIKLNLKPNTSSDNPLSNYTEDVYRRLTNNYIKESLNSSDGILKWIRKESTKTSIPYYSPIGFLGAIGGDILSLAKSILLPGERSDISKTIEEKFGIIARTVVTSAVRRRLNDEEAVTNQVDKIIDNLTKKAPNNDIRRFDREAGKNIEILSKKIIQSQKDDMFRMSRAFPTFKIYFIEEDTPEWGDLDDHYSYSAVSSIDVTRSRSNPVDVAVISLINTLGRLDTSTFGIFSYNDNLKTRGEIESVNRYDQETRREQSLEEFVLKSGTIIKVKMGYSSDPDLLDTVFTGTITEVNGGDMIEVIAQGFGAELMQTCPKSSYSIETIYGFGLLTKLITSAEATHLGRVQWFPEHYHSSMNASRRKIWSNTLGKYIEPTWYRRFRGVNFFLSLTNDTKDDNIYIPPFAERFWYRFKHGKSSFVTKNKTIWDVFREMQIRTPGYITTVVPYDNRATVYFGPSDFLYRYTSQLRRVELDQNINRKRVLSDKDSMLKYMEGSGKYTRYSNNDVQSYFGEAFKYLESLRQDKNLENGVINVRRSFMGSTGGYWEDDAKSFLRTSAQSSLGKTKDEKIMANRLNSLASLLESGNNSSIIYDQSGKVTVSDGEDFFMRKDGTIVNADQEIGSISEIIGADMDMKDKSKKPIISYHMKDSFHHIIANNIVATAENMKNRVVVDFSREMYKKGLLSGVDNVATAIENLLPASDEVDAMVDDSIWPEKIRQKRVREANAHDKMTAWMYAVGHLTEEMKKMYSGSLVISGDPRIKPWDVIFINDYFTDMHGPIEVEQVTHHMSRETGFVTTIVPNLFVFGNNALQAGPTVVAGSFMDSLTSRMLRVREGGFTTATNIIGRATFGLLWLNAGNISDGFIIKLSKIFGDRAYREPINFTPLLYAGRPFIAGVEGMEKDGWYRAISGRLKAAAFHNRDILDLGKRIADTARGITRSREV